MRIRQRVYMNHCFQIQASSKFNPAFRGHISGQMTGFFVSAESVSGDDATSAVATRM
jgi:hypothetical protein